MKIKPFSSMPVYPIRYTRHAEQRMKLFEIKPEDAVKMLKESVEAILPHNFKLKSKYNNPGDIITHWENGYYYINVAFTKDRMTHKYIYLILTVFDKRLSISPHYYNF